MSIELARLKIMLKITDDSKDPLLLELLSLCKEEALTITRQSDEDKLLTVIRLMAVEKYNKLGSEGLQSVNYSGIAESYETDYSPETVKMLNRLRKIKVV